MNNYPSCYACSAPAVEGPEHVPPVCFFPESKDAKGNAPFRKNLIKVPSCALHNSKKSDDDLYAAFHLAGLEGVNHCGDMVRESFLARKASEDWKSREGAFMRRLHRELCGSFDDGKSVAVAEGDRMVEFLRLCARGVYFHRTMEKLVGDLIVTNLGNCYLDIEYSEVLRERVKFFDSKFANSEVFGENPDVFNYSVAEDVEEQAKLVRLVFYGTLRHWVFSHPQVTQQKYSVRVPTAHAEKARCILSDRLGEAKRQR